MKNVVILDGHTIQTLPVAKSLKKQGFYVVLLCETKKSYGYYTRYADERIITPSIKDDTSNFHKAFLDLLKVRKIDVLIPMNDYSAKYLSQHKKELSKYSNFSVPDYNIFMRGYDKNQLMKVCAENNYPHPKTIDLTTYDPKKETKIIAFPALIKPNETTGARGFAMVYSLEDIDRKLPEIVENYGNCHLQEYIPAGGMQFKVELFIHKQKIINATVIQKIRFYPEKGGSSCFNQTVNREDLVDLCSLVLNKIGWEGFADFDLIEDPRDNVVKIMEINPRIPACIKASFSSGVDFVENIVNKSLGLPLNKFNYYPGAYLRYLGLDLLWLLKSKKRFKNWSSWFKMLFSSKQFLQDGSIDDLKPFIYGTIGGFLKQLNPQFRAAKRGMN